MAVTDLNSVAATHFTHLPAGAPLALKGLVYIPAALSGNVTLDATYPNICKFNTGGSNRDITLDAIATSKGLYRRIVNAATGATNLVVKNPAGDTIGTINQNEQGEFYCDGSTWSLICISTIALS
jgi:hypothetical protein